MNAAPAIALHDLTVAYRGHPAVHHLSGRFEAGSMTAIVGPNGAGKSSLLAAIMGRLPAAQGRVEIDKPLRGRMAWLPQHSEIDRSFPLSVFDLVALGLWSRVGAWRGLRAAEREAVHQALAAVGLNGFDRRLIGELSAGQFQRALFARVLLQDAPVILLDEPFNAIDARTTADLLALVHRWHGQARTIVAVLHDMEQVRQHFSHTLLLARRCVAWGPTAQVLDVRHLFEARQMAEAWDEQAPVCTTGHGHSDGHAHEHAHGHEHEHEHSHGHGHGHEAAHGPSIPAPAPAAQPHAHPPGHRHP